MGSLHHTNGTAKGEPACRPGIPQLWYWHGTIQHGSVRFNLIEDASVPSIFPSSYIFYLCLGGAQVLAGVESCQAAAVLTSQLPRQQACPEIVLWLTLYAVKKFCSESFHNPAMDNTLCQNVTVTPFCSFSVALTCYITKLRTDVNHRAMKMLYLITMANSCS